MVRIVWASFKGCQCADCNRWPRVAAFKYIGRMKSCAAVSLILAATLLPALAFSQTLPAPDNSDSLAFVKVAADVGGNVQSDSLVGRIALYVSDKNWPDALKDGDLGPFLKVKEAKPGRSAACIFTDEKDAAICVYFDGKEPFGVVALKASTGGGFKPADVSAAFKPVSKDMLEKGSQGLQFDKIDINTDQGVTLPGFVISKPGLPKT
jgi:hypothetical protein